MLAWVVKQSSCSNTKWNVRISCLDEEMGTKIKGIVTSTYYVTNSRQVLTAGGGGQKKLRVEVSMHQS